MGAISGTAYAKWSWIEATSIDLNPRAPSVIKADFFTLPTPATGEEYDVVCLSLVLNFVGSLEDRGLLGFCVIGCILTSHAGEMLRLVNDHLKPDGLLYLTLPLATVTNSRYIDHARLRGILKACGFVEVRQHDSARLTYWLMRRSPQPSTTRRWAKKPIEGKQSGQRNNFAIVLK